MDDPPTSIFIPLIHRFPPEILILIFKSASVERDVYFFSTARIFVYSHVCRYWRTTALSTPSLWTCIEVGQGSLEAICLRSASLPIRIISLSNSSLNRLDELYNEESWLWMRLSSMQGLLVEAENIAGHEFMRLGLWSLHNLTVLQLHCTSEYIEHIDPPSAAPTLRELTLIAVVMDLSRCQQLTHLHLECFTFELRDCPSAVEIVAVLERCPALKHVYLRSMNIDCGYPSETVAILAYLETLEISDLRTPVAQYIVTHIRIPSFAPITLSLNAPSTRFTDQSWSKHASNTCLCTLAVENGLRRFCIGGVDRRSLYIAISEQITARNSHGTEIFQLGLDIISSVELTHTDAIDLHLIGLEQCVSLHPGPNQWLAFWSHFPRTEAIRLTASNGGAGSALNGLCIRGGGSSCPRLETLYLDLPTSAITAAEIAKILACRSRAKVREIHSLSVVVENIKSGMVEALESSAKSLKFIKK